MKEGPHGRDRTLRRDRHRHRAGRLRRRHPRSPARPAHGRGGARASGRHLPQLGLHPDQGAAAHGGDLRLPRERQEIRPVGRGHRLRHRCHRQALARRLGAAERRRRLPAQQEQGRHHLGRGAHRRARHRRGERALGQDRRAAAAEAQDEARGRALRGGEHHRRHRRPPPRPARHRAGRRAHLDLLRGDGAAGDAEIRAGHGLGRHRHRVRQLLQRDGRGRDRGGAARSGHARRGSRDRAIRAEAVREARHRDRPQGQGRQGREDRDGRARHRRR